MKRILSDFYYLAIDKNMKIVDMNPQWIEEFGEDFIRKGDSLESYLDAEEFFAFEKEIVSLRAKLKPSIQIEASLKGGNEKLVYFRWICYVENERLHCYGLNFSKWKFNESQAKAAEKYLKIGAWSINLADYSAQWSDARYQIHRVNRCEKLNLETIVNCYVPEHRELVRKAIERAIKNGESFEFEAQVERDSEGATRHWVKSYGHCELFNGKVAKVFCLFQDIHKSKIKVTDLEGYRDQLNAVAKYIPGILYTFTMEKDGAMGFTHITEKAEQIYGIPYEEILKNPSIAMEKIHPNDLEDLNQAIVDSANKMTEFEWLGRVVDGEKIKWIRAASTPRKLKSGVIEWHGIMLDVTNEKQREDLIEIQQQQLFATRKFSDLGEVAGGIAHEINTPLAAIGLNVDLIEKLQDSGKLTPEVLREKLDSIRKVVTRVSRIVDTIRSFSRNIVNEPTVEINWQIIVSEALGLVNEKIKQAGIKISLEFSHHHAIMCRFDQILQSVLNLIKNAIDAVESSGQGEAYIKIKTFDQDGRSFLQIVDSGPGVPIEIREKIFDSFFTTKPYGKGTGLGLSLSKEFIESSGGSLSLRSIDEKNTCFEISFPIAENLGKVS